MSHAQAQTAMDVINRAHRRRQPDELLDLLADDARFVQYDLSGGAGRPTVVEGREEVGALLSDVMSRDMSHTVSRQSVGEETVAYHVDCAYPTGQRVAATYVVSLDDQGRIAEIMGTSVWDE